MASSLARGAPNAAPHGAGARGGESGGGGGGGEDCEICCVAYDATLNPRRYLLCGHALCGECLRRIGSLATSSSAAVSCPFCRWAPALVNAGDNAAAVVPSLASLVRPFSVAIVALPSWDTAPRSSPYPRPCRGSPGPAPPRHGDAFPVAVTAPWPSLGGIGAGGIGGAAGERDVASAVPVEACACETTFAVDADDAAENPQEDGASRRRSLRTFSTLHLLFAFSILVMCLLGFVMVVLQRHVSIGVFLIVMSLLVLVFFAYVCLSSDILRAAFCTGKVNEAARERREPAAP